MNDLGAAAAVSVEEMGFKISVKGFSLTPFVMVHVVSRGHRK